MSEIEKIYRWRKKKGTGRHYFSYDGDRYALAGGSIVICPVRFVRPCLDQYECLGEIDKYGDTIPVGDKSFENDDLEQEEDLKLELHHLGRGWYDVYNPKNPDKPINSKALRREEACKLAGIEYVE